MMCVFFAGAGRRGAEDLGPLLQALPTALLPDGAQGFIYTYIYIYMYLYMHSVLSYSY